MILFSILNHNGLKVEQEIEELLIESLSKRQRNFELEKIIAKFPHYSVVYAKKVIQGRFPIAEDTIGTNPYYVCAYSSVLNLTSVPENIHRLMLSNAIKEKNIDDPINYWIKEYFKFCSYLEGKNSRPWWLGNESINWNYGNLNLDL
jgi:hypothetical protein